MKTVNFPKISVVIPNYNDSETLPSCLEAVLASDYPDFEVIVVDDKSTDNSVEIIKKYKVKLVEHSKNRRQGAARNTGVSVANGDIILFIDGDVCVYKDTIKKIVGIFLKKEGVSAIVGLPDKKCVYKNLPSIHFNRRVHFNYLRLPEHINIIYGTVSAVKKNVFLRVGGFNENITGVEDVEIGYRLVSGGYKIFHSKDLLVLHLRFIGFWDILKNDFNRTVDRVKLLFGRKHVKKVISEKRFVSSPLYQLLSPFVAFFFFFSLPLFLFWKFLIFLPVFGFFTFLFLNWNYLAFNFKEEGLFFSIRLFCFMLFDMLIVFFALICGCVLFIKGEKY